MRLVAVFGLAYAIAGAATATATEAPRAFTPKGVPPARFADPDRAKKLAAAWPEVDRAFREYNERAHPPGLAWGVIVDGVLVHKGALGVRDTGTNAPAQSDSVFRIASMTKSFTALAILKLRDEKRLSLDDPVARYVPELAGLPYPTRDSPEITIRHLLTHSEGFPEDNPWGDRQLAVNDALISKWMRAGLPFSNAPGIAFEYSNYGFAILGQVVARVSGRRYSDYMNREILKPLGMSSSVWEAPSVAPDRLARGYRREGESWVEEVPLADGAFGAMGGLYSTVEDLARYVAFYLSAWPPRDDEDRGPVRRASVREMQQEARPYRARASRNSLDGPLQLNAGGYAYGLGAGQSCRFAHVVAHSGGLPGFGSQMRWLPEHGVGVIALANATYASPGRAVSESLEAMWKTGALQPRAAQPAPALTAAREGALRLLESWQDSAYESLAADNLSLDVPRDKRKKEFADLHTAHGACRAEGGIQAENALRGEWSLACERGKIKLSLTLAPTLPPRVQYIEATSVLPLAPGLEAAASALVARIGAPSGSVDDLLAPGVEAAPVAKAVAAAAAWGTCRMGEVQAGGGDAATVRFDCEKGALQARLALDPESGKLKSLSLQPGPDDACVP